MANEGKKVVTLMAHSTTALTYKEQLAREKFPEYEFIDCDTIKEFVEKSDGSPAIILDTSRIVQLNASQKELEALKRIAGATPHTHRAFVFKTISGNPHFRNKENEVHQILRDVIEPN